jgi:putative ATP-binding cassette transporter
MRGLFSVLKGSYPLLIFTVITSVVTGLFSTLIIKEIHASLTSEETFDATAFSIYFFSMVVAYLIASVLASVSIASINRGMIHQLRLMLSEKVLSAPYERVENLKSNILPVLTDDLNHISNLVNRLPSVTTGFATVFGILAYLFWLSPLMGFLTFGAFFIVLLVNLVNMRYLGKYAKLNRAHTNTIYKVFEGLVYGIANLMLHKKFKKRYVDEKLKVESQKQMRWYFRETVFNAMNNRLNDGILMAFLGVMILLVYIFNIVTVSFFNTYLTLILFMLGPLSTVSGFWGTVKRIEAALVQVKKLGIRLDESAEERKKRLAEESRKEQHSFDQNEELPAETPLIKLKNLDFTYRFVDNPFQLNDINLEIYPGQRLFIEGGNGSGKSTLIKVICGLYLPQEGSVFYRGKEITDKELASFRDQFAVVLTDSYLFDDLGHLSEEKRTKAEMYLEMLEMNHKVSFKNGKFSSVDLSSGQKKRLQLVHMLMEDKEIYIFDEWVAYQDRHSKELFYTKVLPYLKDQGKTVINIAHDYTYENLADIIVKMEDGVIVSKKRGEL